jgi:hypothetical protein
LFVNLQLIGPALTLASVAAATAAWSVRRSVFTAAIAAITGIAALLPIRGTSVASFLLALLGPASAASLVIWAQVLLMAMTAPRPRLPISTALAACVVVSGILLYPMTAGLGPIDPYDLGYRGIALPALMAIFVVTGWLAGGYDVSIWIGGAVVLYLFRINGSDNLWDYLIDPVTVLAAFVILNVRALQLIRNSLVRKS